MTKLRAEQTRDILLISHFGSVLSSGLQCVNSNIKNIQIYNCICELNLVCPYEQRA